MKPPVRRRLWLALAILVTVVLGLASRRYPGLFPAFLGKYPGDVLWALMVYWIVGWCAPRATLRQVAGGALLVSFADEFSQLYRAPWLDQIRSTTVGHLILGSTFSWLDLLAYVVGIALGVGLELAILRLALRDPRVNPEVERS